MYHGFGSLSVAYCENKLLRILRKRSFPKIVKCYEVALFLSFLLWRNWKNFKNKEFKLKYNLLVNKCFVLLLFLVLAFFFIIIYLNFYFYTIRDISFGPFSSFFLSRDRFWNILSHFSRLCSLRNTYTCKAYIKNKA